jgi:hypothetical protein
MITLDDATLESIRRLYEDSRTVITVGAFLKNAQANRRELTDSEKVLVDYLMFGTKYDLDDLERIGKLLSDHPVDR